MPTVFNPSRFNLWCEPADQEIPANRGIEVSDDVAAQISRCVFTVEGNQPEPEAETEDEDEAPKKAPATRKTATRGAKKAEVTGPPEAETRAW